VETYVDWIIDVIRQDDRNDDDEEGRSSFLAEGRVRSAAAAAANF